MAVSACSVSPSTSNGSASSRASSEAFWRDPNSSVRHSRSFWLRSLRTRRSHEVNLPCSSRPRHREELGVVEPGLGVLADLVGRFGFQAGDRTGNRSVCPDVAVGQATAEKGGLDLALIGALEVLAAPPEVFPAERLA